MAYNNIIQNIRDQRSRLDAPEDILGKELMQPNTSSNSGARKIMYGIHVEHTLQVTNPEVPIVQTGYENKFGELSSSFVTADADYRVLERVPKFSLKPEHIYYAFLYNEAENLVHVVERCPFYHITEAYGYMKNNDSLDFATPGSYIDKGDVIYKSRGFDDQNNRMDGVNLRAIYLAKEGTKEDSFEISESAAKKLDVSLIKTVSIQINDNDIPLNIYGFDNVYKVIPDICEETNSGRLCSIRRKAKENSLYAQSYDKLKEYLISDEIYSVSGKVVDIDIYVNKPENLSSFYYNAQLKYYYDERTKFNNTIVALVEQYRDEYNCKLSYDLQKLYANCKKELDGMQFSKSTSVFSNITLDITVLDVTGIKEGDKLSNRYGGKGVVSRIVPDDEMPTMDDGTKPEIIFNQLTMHGRKNFGQAEEMDINMVGARLIQLMSTGALDIATAFAEYNHFIKTLSEEEEDYMKVLASSMDDNEVESFIGSILDDKGIYVSLRPIRENMSIDKLAKLHKEFPYARLYSMLVPLKDSNGNVRQVKARRPISYAPQYIYRLKQYAEEKFSATSLSATNMKNENAKSKANKVYKDHITKTPIQFGEMETGDQTNVGMEQVAVNLMLHSASPKARRMAEQLLIGDPFDIDIKLDDESTNRNVEIMNAYLKAMGVKLEFSKTLIERASPMLWQPLIFYPGHQMRDALSFTKDTNVEYNRKLNDLNTDSMAVPMLWQPFRYYDERMSTIGDSTLSDKDSTT